VLNRNFKSHEKIISAKQLCSAVGDSLQNLEFVPDVAVVD